jgi:LPS sulfotransferase NodH
VVAARLQSVATRWFGRHRIRPFIVCYEDLVEDMEGTLRAVLDFLDIRLPRGTRIKPSLKPQADEVNAGWTALYRERARTLPPGSPLLIDPMPRE